MYAPGSGTSNVPNEHSRQGSAKGPFLEAPTDVHGRPSTPTPYSVLRKVSEYPQSENGLRAAKSQDSQEDLTAEDRSASDTGRSERWSGSVSAQATPVLRDEQGRVLSKIHPLLRASGLNSETRHTKDTAASSKCSTKAEYGGSDAGTGTGTSQGIAISKPVEVTETAPGTGAASTRDNSLYSRRPTTLQDDVPDLESIRRGPRVRHSRLPPSPSMAADAGWNVPRSTRELWGALDRLRRLMLISAILLELSILSLVSSVTAAVVEHAEQGHVGLGLVAWAAVSSVFVLILAGLLGIAFLRYRRMGKDLVSGENWIEMHLRSRPLPPRPQSEEREQDSGATEAWQKFVQDHEQLRRYVELLESRIGVLEEGRLGANQRNNGCSNSETAGAGSSAAGNLENGKGQPGIPTHGDNTPKAKKPGLMDSLSCRQLLQAGDEGAEPEPWLCNDRNGAILKSDTKTSILTELCAAVTEGYSPLSQQM
ncbi:2d1b3f80-7407-4450-a725-beb46c7f2aba [Thermothielavioides terrestris]|uniref:2d1b3f80-7407-4450-a725-beb46c7f2aba n=1 Tax=Thermothielavioides terrestris TaxID=2587410 RepID=A0A446BVU3_9PEZI|nr:2d1b3f80-7407-4450-a725-beb46c7f2aba [Thermothielavioides terrestris]